jgi:succinate dehydrogenase hydrophobic anchor subunit
MEKARKFYLIFCSVLLVHSAIAFYRHHASAGRVSGILSVSLLGLHFAAPAFSLTLYRLYTALFMFLGKCLTKLFMVLFFYVILFPYGWILRLLSGDLLHRELRPKKVSYWIEREPVHPDIADKRCENPF